MEYGLLFDVGIHASESMPLLLFIGIGAMIDFGPLLKNPKRMFFGAAAQFGIFITITASGALGFDLKDAASIGIIGAADGPTSILVSQVLGSSYFGAIAVAAYSYMALVPIIQPFAIKLVTTKKERAIKMEYDGGDIPRITKILFPIIVTLVAGLVAPASVSLVGMLMFGNLIREWTGRLGRLSETASKGWPKPYTAAFGISIAEHETERLCAPDTVIRCLGLVASLIRYHSGRALA
jgi:oxaloacetate decarboxylase beta subunit